MKFNAALLSVVALGAALAAPNYAQPVFAQDDAKAEAAEDSYKLDESIFAIETEKDVQYYKDAEKKLRDEMSKFIAATKDREKLYPVFDKANAALFDIRNGILNAKDVDLKEQAEALEMVGETLLEQGKMDEFKALVKKFESSEDKAIKNVLMGFEGKERFANLVGNEVKMEGLFLDGTELKWEEYRGKIVLIDFWATWCGPCCAEIPNVKAMYEKYHDAGFEVVGYSLDRDVDALKKFEEEKKLPWKTMSRAITMDSDKEYMNMSSYYGVNAIPTMILVDKDGKAIDTEARGEHLRELLEKAFPDVK